MSERVSIIVPTFNRASTISRALNSIFRQSLTDFEIYLVDDGSTDKTTAVLANIDDRRLKVFRQSRNLGVSAARNFGIRNSSGNWLAFLDSDDEWLPEKLEHQLAYVTRNPKIRIIHTNELWRRNGKHLNQKKYHQKSGGRLYTTCLARCMISPSTVMIHRSVFEDVGYFREDFPVCEDYDLWLRICTRYEVGYLDTPLIVKHGGHDDQLSRRYRAMDYWRLKSLLSNLNNNFLSDDEHLLTKQTAAQKLKILLNGYAKHGNQQKIEELSKIAQLYFPQYDFNLSSRPDL